jgi:hypothetical protein
VRKALSTLPWVEQASIKPNTSQQQVTFAVKDKESFDLDELKKTIEGKTNFKVGKVLKGP